MNDLAHGNAVQAATIIPGSMWRFAGTKSPWPDDGHAVKIIDAKDGWVRYCMGTVFTDERLPESSFRRCYAPTFEYATGKLLAVPVPRDELEAAINDLLCAFHYYAGETNYAVRDAAIRRAQLAIGAKVTL